MVKVACRVANGLMIQRFKDGPDDGTGQKRQVKHGLAIRLAGPAPGGSGVGSPDGSHLDPGITEVPDSWGFDEWLKQNQNNPHVTQGLVSLVPEDDKVPNGK